MKPSQPTKPAVPQPAHASGPCFKPHLLALSVCLLSTANAIPAWAQQENTGESKEAVLEEIVVTGTLIRGSAPVGTQTISMDAQQIQATGAMSATQLMETIPQNASFNNLQYSTAASNFITINRPNLRDLPETGGGSPTLVLLNGHRIVGMGVRSTSPDVDIVPPSLTQRVEIVPDGGSAIYGSDAVSGVVNFITRKDYEGIGVDVQYGTADHYDEVTTSITGGYLWDTGSVYLAYNYTDRDDISGGHRDWVKMYPNFRQDIPLLNQPVTALTCQPGNVRVNGQSYALPYTTGNAVPGTVNQCDLSDGVSIYPKQTRDSVMAGFSQQFGDKVLFETQGFWMDRDTTGYLGPNTATVSIAPGGSPYRDAHLATGSAAEIQAVDIQFDTTRKQDISLDTWGIYPTLTVELPKNWQLRAMTSYGESKTVNHDGSANTNAINTAVSSGLINPYDMAASNPAALAAVTNYETYGHTKQTLFDMSAIIDGDLFELPGGAVKLAAGAEYQDQGYDVQAGDIYSGTQNSGFGGLTIDGVQVIAPSDPLDTVKLDRDITSYFGELVVPVFGPGNAVTGIEELSLSASVRYDDYSDFGDPSNPKYGITWRPLEWVTLRGAWGDSFTAPSLADDFSTTVNSANYAAIPFLFPPQELIDNGTYPPVQPGQQVIVLLGNAPGIEAQTAETQSIGIDIEPPFIPGLSVSLTWWDIEYNGLIDLPGFVTQFPSWTTFASFKTVAPSQGQIDEALGSVDSIVGTCTPQPDCVYAITDARVNNTGNFKTDGLDLGAFYATDTSFGTIDFQLNTTYVLNREQSVADGAEFNNELDTDYSRFKASASVGTNIGQWRAEATLYHTQGYDLGAPVGYPSQDNAGDYNTVNLFVLYDVQGEGWLSDLSLTFNASNIFNSDPPEYRVTDTLVLPNNGYINGRTIGRLFQFGIQKHF